MRNSVAIISTILNIYYIYLIFRYLLMILNKYFRFGCCPDNETPASGKDNIGCCNVTEFGCCPDGIKPASGPNEEGAL